MQIKLSYVCDILCLELKISEIVFQDVYFCPPIISIYLCCIVFHVVHVTHEMNTLGRISINHKLLQNLFINNYHPHFSYFWGNSCNNVQNIRKYKHENVRSMYIKKKTGAFTENIRNLYLKTWRVYKRCSKTVKLLKIKHWMFIVFKFQIYDGSFSFVQCEMSKNRFQLLHFRFSKFIFVESIGFSW